MKLFYTFAAIFAVTSAIPLAANDLKDEAMNMAEDFYGKNLASEVSVAQNVAVDCQSIQGDPQQKLFKCLDKVQKVLDKKHVSIDLKSNAEQMVQEGAAKFEDVRGQEISQLVKKIITQRF